MKKIYTTNLRNKCRKVAPSHAPTGCFLNRFAGLSRIICGATRVTVH
nr:MAG TPA: hypothetical protein [Bacteriophage sp.]